jgi:hypothetical protein
MSETPDHPADESPEERRRRRLAEVFGDVLPESTRDDQPDTGGHRSGRDDDWFRDQVPPHHG